MRVVYLNPSGQLGGAEVALLDLVASLRDAEPDWDLHLIAGGQGLLIERARELGVSARAVSFPPALARLGDSGLNPTAEKRTSRTGLLKKLFEAGTPALKYIQALKTELSQIKPDLIHTNGFKMHVLGARACPKKSTPLVWHVRDYVSSRPVMARLLRLHTAKCAAAITNSQSVAGDLRAVCGVDLRVNPVLDAIDLVRFSPEGSKLDLDSLAGMPEADAGTVRVGLLATMARWKGHRTFLQALALLPKETKVRAYVIGGALYQTDDSQHSLEELKDEAARLGVAHRVGFTGYVEDAASAMRSLDIVVHASTQPEPFGLVIAEAMACGRALIASEAGGAAEIIDPEVDAIAHKPGDAQALSECINRLANDAELRERLGRNGRRTAEQRFDRTRLAGEVIPIYYEALASRN
jgi:glycosyltransferase involved in cell wall biosynthesis